MTFLHRQAQTDRLAAGLSSFRYTFCPFRLFPSFFGLTNHCDWYFVMPDLVLNDAGFFLVVLPAIVRNLD